jgi:hypothetical protein
VVIYNEDEREVKSTLIRDLSFTLVYNYSTFFGIRTTVFGVENSPAVNLHTQNSKYYLCHMRLDNQMKIAILPRIKWTSNVLSKYKRMEIK